MATSVAAIATEAFTAVAAELPDAIKAASHRRATVGDYDTVTGTVSSTNVDTACRVVFATVDAIPDVFPDLVTAPGDQLVYAEGLGSVVPKEGDHLTAAGATWQVRAAQDLVQANGLHALLVRRT